MRSHVFLLLKASFPRGNLFFHPTSLFYHIKSASQGENLTDFFRVETTPTNEVGAFLTVLDYHLTTAHRARLLFIHGFLLTPQKLYAKKK